MSKTLSRRGVLLLALCCWPGVIAVQAQEDGPLDGVLAARPSIPAARARQQCITLPVKPIDDRGVVSPHGNSLLNSKCEVIEFAALATPLQPGWFVARYLWTSTFTAEDASRGPAAKDIVTEEEAVLFDTPQPGQVRPVWHERFETGPYAVLRSITPEVASAGPDTVLLSVMRCVNGTGGCAQEFLHRHADGRWFPVRQDWLTQLPSGFAERIRHGTRIDPRVLRGEAGFYSNGDPNCCPHDLLTVILDLRGDSLVLVRHSEAPQP